MPNIHSPDRTLAFNYEKGGPWVGIIYFNKNTYSFLAGRPWEKTIAYGPLR